MRFVWQVILPGEKFFCPCVERSGISLEIVNLEESFRVRQIELAEVGVNSSVGRSEVGNSTGSAQASPCHDNNRMSTVQPLTYFLHVLIHIVQVGIAKKTLASAQDARVNKKPQKFIFEYWAFSQKSYLNGGCFEEIHICIPKILYLHTS